MNGERERERDLRERILLYLYDELSDAERVAFEADVEREPELRRLLEEERRLDQLCPVGSGYEVSDALLAEHRRDLRTTLDGVTRDGVTRDGDAQAPRPDGFLTDVRRRLAVLFAGPLPAGAAVAAAAVILLLIGALLGRTVLAPAPGDHLSTLAASPVGLIGADDLEVVDLRIASFDRESGRIRFAFDAISRATVEGNVGDAAVQNLLATAIQADLRPAARLRTVEVLQDQTGNAQIRQALIDALLTDRNPAVRLRAIEVLKELAANDQVREALRGALLHDGNPGVRIEAIEVLRNYNEPATVEVLRQKAGLDGNRYVRAEAERMFEQWTQQPSEQL